MRGLSARSSRSLRFSKSFNRSKNGDEKVGVCGVLVTTDGVRMSGWGAVEGGSTRGDSKEVASERSEAMVRDCKGASKTPACFEIVSIFVLGLGLDS